MKRNKLKYFLWGVILLFGMGIYSLNADYLAYTAVLPELELIEEAPQDTVKKPANRYPVSKTTPQEYQDIVKRSPADLHDPENVKTSIDYDLRTNTYVVRTKLGDMEIGTPMTLTPEEYQDYSLQQSLRSYFRQKNEEEYQKVMNKQLNLTDMQFDIGIAERIFGPGGVRVKTQGSAELTMGLKRNSQKNPSLPESQRTRTFFNFDENVQLNMQASVGTKVNFGMNYNTETSFDFDSKQLKLAYTGEEDEVIKSLEAGNVSMTTGNSLINGGAALFGMKADLQFGKLRVNTLFAQQNSESKTVSSKGGVQTKPFEITVDSYDENRHFFLSHYFYEHYDESMKNLTYVTSPVLINRIEVWITNKQSNYDQARNIVAFSDLAEPKVISHSSVTSSGGNPNAIPYNTANSLYNTLINQFQEARDISRVTQVLSANYEGSVDFEKIESARLLSESEYTLNKQLGYISLKTQLQADEVLGVAFSYTYGGKTYQVGEFSTDNSENTSTCLYVKLLKGTTMSPSLPFWKLMMKNIYSLGAYNVQKEKFKLNVSYQSDTTGTYINYMPEGTLKNETFLTILNVDNLDLNNEPYPDGFFDFVEGITVQSEIGRIIFPSVEPFGSYLYKKLGGGALAEKYVYQELYDTTKTAARQNAEKNKFILTGEYKASSGAEIQLGASNVARGSVRVTAAGATLVENVDYTVDYTSGVVTILNESIIAAGTPVSVSLENQSVYNMQRKTMMGLDLSYEFSKDFLLGATIMHLSEMPLTTKTVMGDESVKNTLWGLNASYKGESQWLTNMLDKLPLLTLTKPSQIAFNAEFAHLIAGHYENKNTGGYSYLDDFESTQSSFDLTNPYSWQLASTPYDDGINPLFPEASKVNDIDYGKNRALLAWYYIDGMFTRKNSSVLPSYITKDDLSNHYVRAVKMSELYPKREQGYNESNLIQVLNLAYYPKERGPYNLDADRVNSDGSLQEPEKRWGGIMRKIDQSDFETANIEYIEFWMLDPYIYNPNAKGGDLYFNLGEISEDILKDGKKFFENGLPVDGDQSKVELTNWGKVPTQQSTVYAFDNTEGARELQDVGLNGLSSEEEKSFPTYADFLQKLQSKLSGEVYSQMLNDPLSPFNDPASDDFRYFRNELYDERQASILERYKRYNGAEGNSRESRGRYTSASKTLPDVEDINQDNTLNETEKYYEYKVSLRPEDLMSNKDGYIADVREATPTLANGSKNETVKWYLFKIPVKNYNRKIGSIGDFKSVRFMRMYMTGFRDTTILRFGSLELVRGEWRAYDKNLANFNSNPAQTGTLSVSTVNIEENGDRLPVGYVLPPGVSRVQDPSQPQLRQQNEQSLSLKVENLSPQDARAIYKSTHYDLRQYKRIQLFTHAEAIEDESSLNDGDMVVFLRLGSDYKNNYYEYAVPLTKTPWRSSGNNYNDMNDGDRRLVWPAENMIDFQLEKLTNLKLERNKKKRTGVNGVTYATPYSIPDKDNPRNQLTIVGNPSLAEVKTIMIGVRNTDKEMHSAEVWVNELRLTDFNESGGWAANANLNVTLSDFGTVNMAGRIETAGFGALDQSLAERRMENYSQYSVATNFELGKLFPEKAKVSIPLYYAYSKEMINPDYDPMDKDIKLSDALDAVETKAEKDSIKDYAQERTIIKSVSLNNVKVDIRSRNPMPYDPANFSFGYSYSQNSKHNADMEYETTKDYRGNFAYNYTPYVKPFRPFEKLPKNNGYTRFIKQLGLNYVPSNISFQTAMMRNYYELQLRDLTKSGPSENRLKPSISQNFLWDRAFSMRWDFTNNLSVNFSSGTQARIEEPHVRVNRKEDPDQYKVWKDSVKQSIRDLGTPLAYDQTFSATWNMPLQQIPVLDWVNSSVSYQATYNWDRGAQVADSSKVLGNTIRNQRTIDWQGNFNLTSLYNKNKYLKKINQKYSSSPRNNRNNDRTKKRKEVKLEKDIQLNLDSGTVVEHGMLTKKLHVRAKGADGKTYAVKFKPINYAQIMILNKDTAHLKLSIYPGPEVSEQRLVKALEYSTRFLMMLRRISVQYSVNDGMMLPGYLPEVGDILGQKRSGNLAPGLGFAFGSVNRSFINDAWDRGWLVNGTDNITPAMMDRSTTLNIRGSLEPFPGLKIDLNANRIETRNTEIQYMYSGMPEQLTGSYTMTMVALSSFFGGSGNASNGYSSKSFKKFLANRAILTDRLQQAYMGTVYPNRGFLQNNAIAGLPYDQKQGAVSPNSADVLIPAFLSAYTGSDPKKISFSPFPALKSMVPNWRITYDGLIRIPFINKHFKSMMLNHQYRCSYNVGSYSSYMNWVDAGNGFGFMESVSGTPTPSSLYDISSVSLTESFSPLLGVDAVMLNNVTGRIEYRTTRNLSLNIPSTQIVESLSNEIIVGVGYKLTEFNKMLRMKKTQNFSNDLTLRLDFSYRRMQSLIRKIQEELTQATSGNIAKTISFSADYGLSRALTVRAFYDLQINNPLVSSASFPTSNSNYGFSLRFSLAQ